MGVALIRLEDLGPGGHYESPENQAKLAVVADFLLRQRIPFQAAVIPRYVDPDRGTDRRIDGPPDAVATPFQHLLKTFANRGASLGMHGYTHQYDRAVSGEGFEFSYPDCRQDCPPDDPPSVLESMTAFQSSYAFGRIRAAYSSFLAAGLRPDWFETPHYAASEVQRRVLDACSGVIYETNPDAPDSRQVSLRPSLSRAGFTPYVPTPLGYVCGTRVREDIRRIVREAAAYGERDLASFFYHPFLEFPYIARMPGGAFAYAGDSPLHELVREFSGMGRRFVSIREVLGTA